MGDEEFFIEAPFCDIWIRHGIRSGYVFLIEKFISKWCYLTTDLVLFYGLVSLEIRSIVSWVQVFNLMEPAILLRKEICNSAAWELCFDDGSRFNVYGCRGMRCLQGSLHHFRRFDEKFQILNTMGVSSKHSMQTPVLRDAASITTLWDSHALDASLVADFLILSEGRSVFRFPAEDRVFTKKLALVWE